MHWHVSPARVRRRLWPACKLTTTLARVSSRELLVENAGSGCFRRATYSSLLRIGQSPLGAPLSMNVSEAGFHLCTANRSYSAAVLSIVPLISLQGRQFSSAKDESAMSSKSFVGKIGFVKPKFEGTTAQPTAKPARTPPSTPASIKGGKGDLAACGRSAQKPFSIKATGVNNHHLKKEGSGSDSVATVSKRDGGTVPEQNSLKENPKLKKGGNLVSSISTKTLPQASILYKVDAQVEASSLLKSSPIGGSHNFQKPVRPVKGGSTSFEQNLKGYTSIQVTSTSVKPVANPDFPARLPNAPYDNTTGTPKKSPVRRTNTQIKAEAKSGRIPTASKRIETGDVSAQMTRPLVEAKSCLSKIISSQQPTAGSTSTIPQPSFKLSRAQTIQLCSEWWITCFQRSGQVFSDLNFPFANMQIWVLAYQRAYTQWTGKQADEKVLSEVYLSLQQLFGIVLNRKYSWGGEKRIYLSSPDNDIGGQNQKFVQKVSSSGCFQDIVVQEALLIVLEPIFEARFSFRSHASRPGRNAHTALRAVRSSFAGCVWFIRGEANILHDEVYISRFVDSFLRAVNYPPVYFLIKDGLSTSSSLKMEGGTEKTSGVSNWGACQKLVSFFCNIFMDQVDQFIEAKISSLSKEKPAPSRSFTPLLLKSPRKTTKKMHRIEYVRHGTEFLIASNGSLQDVTELNESVTHFINKQLWVDTSNTMKISHVSMGIDFLDHSILQKVVRPIVFRRTASSGRAVEKRACRVVLCIKASRKCCQNHLKKLGTPASVEQIKEMLRVLTRWYSLAENQKKAIQFCRLFLCSLYARDHDEKHIVLTDASLGDAPNLQQSTRVEDQSICVSHLQTCHGVDKEKKWVPEHEKSLRDMAFFRCEENLASAIDALKEMEKLSPQQTMSQLVWHFTRESASENGAIGQGVQVG